MGTDTIWPTKPKIISAWPSTEDAPRPSLELFRKHPDLWHLTRGSRDPLSHLLIECGPVGGHCGSFRQDQKTPTCVWLCSVFGKKHTSDFGEKPNGLATVDIHFGEREGEVRRNIGRYDFWIHVATSLGARVPDLWVKVVISHGVPEQLCVGSCVQAFPKAPSAGGGPTAGSHDTGRYHGVDVRVFRSIYLITAPT